MRRGDRAAVLKRQSGPSAENGGYGAVLCYCLDNGMGRRRAVPSPASHLVGQRFAGGADDSLRAGGRLKSRQLLLPGDGGNLMRRTKSRKRGEERIESSSGAVRMNSMPGFRSM